MAKEMTVEALPQQPAEQATQIALLIQQNSEQTAQIKLHIEENARLKKRIEQLERQVKRYVAPHSRETCVFSRYPASNYDFIRRVNLNHPAALFGA